ncbi:uncharacterized protein [Palaemon carinicauda]|uniref:uncharacterized protein n=1 Tax=Palaemon carinicauda TaxID=392227 RepID=UPI0035B58111
MVGKLGVRLNKPARPGTARLRARTPAAAATEEVHKETEDTEPLLSGEKKGKGPRYVPTDWDDSLPYGGKVYLARRKLPDSWLCIILQVLVVALAIGLVYYAWYHGEHMHFHVTKAYAHFGHKEAQATVGHKLLVGKGVEKNHTAAMEWFKKAADQGHPHASYNLAVGHLQGYKIGLEPGDAHRLIQHAASNGVPEAVDVLERVCSRGHCDV